MANLNWTRIAELAATVVTFAVIAIVATGLYLGRDRLFRFQPDRKWVPVEVHSTGATISVPSHITTTTQTVIPSRNKTAAKKPVYRRVLPGGNIDGQVNCKAVENFRQYDYATVQKYAGDYGVPAAVVQRYRVCFQ